GVFVALIAIIGAGIAIQFGVNRMQASRDVAVNVNQSVNQNSTPVDSPPVVSTSSDNLRGVWAGTYGPLATATKLTIKNHNGNSLDGVLEQGTLRVAFKGTYDSGSRTLKMQQ